MCCLHSLSQPQQDRKIKNTHREKIGKATASRERYYLVVFDVCDQLRCNWLKCMQQSSVVAIDTAAVNTPHKFT